MRNKIWQFALITGMTFSMFTLGCEQFPVNSDMNTKSENAATASDTPTDQSKDLMLNAPLGIASDDLEAAKYTGDFLKTLPELQSKFIELDDQFMGNFIRTIVKPILEHPNDYKKCSQEVLEAQKKEMGNAAKMAENLFHLFTYPRPLIVAYTQKDHQEEFNQIAKKYELELQTYQWKYQSEVDTFLDQMKQNLDEKDTPSVVEEQIKSVLEIYFNVFACFIYGAHASSYYFIEVLDELTQILSDQDAQKKIHPTWYQKSNLQIKKTSDNQYIIQKPDADKELRELDKELEKAVNEAKKELKKKN